MDHRPRQEVHQLVSAQTNGATPLVLSCRNGHKDVVEYLVERCNANVEQPGRFLGFTAILAAEHPLNPVIVIVCLFMFHK